jgi:hypothetical protein
MTSIIDSCADGADRRSHPRYSDRSPVYVGDGALARKCSLIDISEGGARISVAKGVALPRDVVLVDPRTGLSHRATLVWRTETEAGVRFVKAGVRYRVMTSTDDLVRETVERPSRRAS